MFFNQHIKDRQLLIIYISNDLCQILEKEHFSGVRVNRLFSFMCMFCRSLFVLLSLFFWPLCCLFFFDLRILITSLVSPNPSHYSGTTLRNFLPITLKESESLEHFKRNSKIYDPRNQENKFTRCCCIILMLYNSCTRRVLYNLCKCHV